ncbi:TRAFAC clade GTPase domain-containing protein [Rubripirellula reticaptiva]|uniref:TRAFAC clade GTPase domain-containing protein n=1 Tax=Rubripirellula reticaptiva TaxID=2528013 RepID=UPI0011B5EE8D|nr:hypothetical protein [Rubripirellula reticaptiva]
MYGNHDRYTCEHWQTTEIAAEESSTEHDTQVAPWHSDALSKLDINLVSVQRRPHVIALVGPHNAGKTTYLAAIHLLCLREPVLKDFSFAGSLTLRGWQRIIESMQYPRDKNLPPSYPPHTPNSNERVPGLLHYTLRTNEDEGLQEILLTDAPGEWFTSWACNPDESMYPGAVWTIRNADAYLFFVDSDALAGDEPGVARSTIESMAMRLAEERNEKPVGIVWSKSDVKIDGVIEQQVETILSRELPDATSFRMSVRPQKGNDPEMMVESLKDTLEFATTKQPVAIDFQTDCPTGNPEDRFLSYRGNGHV